MNQDVIDRIKLLDPMIEVKYSDEQLDAYIDIMQPIAVGDGLVDAELISGTSFLVLDTTFNQTSGLMSGISRKKIKDIVIEYAEPRGGRYPESPWMRLYRLLVTGELDAKYTDLQYIGIE